MYAESQRKINQHIQSELYQVPVVFENDRLTGDPRTHIRVTNLPIGNVAVEIGVNGRNRHDSMVSFDIFTLIGEGTGEAAELVDYIMKALFPRDTTLVTDDSSLTIKFGVPTPLRGRDDGHGYYQITVHCPWRVFS